MVRPVQNWSRQVVESRVDDIEGVAAHLLDGSDFGNEKTALADNETARLDLQPDGMAEGVFQPLA